MNKTELQGKIAAEIDKSRAKAEKEIAKVKKQIDGTISKVEGYVKKNPEKAAMIAAGVGAALGSVLTAFMTHKKKSAAKKGKK